MNTGGQTLPTGDGLEQQVILEERVYHHEGVTRFLMSIKNPRLQRIALRAVVFLRKFGLLRGELVNYSRTILGRE